MREVRAAAECLSAACRAGKDPLIHVMVQAWADTIAEPIPAALQRTLDMLEPETSH